MDRQIAEHLEAQGEEARMKRASECEQVKDEWKAPTFWSPEKPVCPRCGGRLVAYKGVYEGALGRRLRRQEWAWVCRDCETTISSSKKGEPK